MSSDMKSVPGVINIMPHNSFL